MSVFYPFGEPKSREMRKPTKADVRKVLEKQKWKCTKCGKDVSKIHYEIDHKKPLSEGGTNSPRNLQILCLQCHRDKTLEGKSRRAKRKRKQKEESNSFLDIALFEPPKRRSRKKKPIFDI